MKKKYLHDESKPATSPSFCCSIWSIGDACHNTVAYLSARSSIEFRQEKQYFDKDLSNHYSTSNRIY
jgi:hypothetical protein